MLRLEFRMPLEGVLATLRERLSCSETVELDNVVPTGEDRAMAFVTVGGTDCEVTAALGGYSAVRLKHHTESATDDATHLLLMVGFDDSVVSTVAGAEAVPHRFVATGDLIEAVATVEDWTHLRSLASAIEAEHGTFELRGTTELDRPGYPLGRDKFQYAVYDALTPDQREVLETAYRMGHFAVPQQATSEEVAEALGIGRSTLSERLRRAENDLLRLLFRDH